MRADAMSKRLNCCLKYYFVATDLVSTASPVTDFDWIDWFGVCRRLFRALRSIATYFARGAVQSKSARSQPTLRPFRQATLAADFSARRVVRPSWRNGRAAFWPLRDRRSLEAPLAPSDYIR